MDKLASLKNKCSIMDTARSGTFDATANDRQILAHFAKRFEDRSGRWIKGHFEVQIAKRIAGKRKFGKHDRIGPFFTSPFTPFQMFADITFHITKKWRKLRK